MVSCCLLALAVCSQETEAAGDHWPQFRGTGATGVSPDHDGLPLTWTRSDNVQWVTDLPGWGWSCPIISGNRVFLTTVVSDEKNPVPGKGLYLGAGVRDPAQGIHHWLVYCLDLKSGTEIWKREVHTGRPEVPRHPKSTYAAETPVTDGKRLYVLFGDLGLYCFDLDGKPLWTHAIKPKKTVSDYGAAASPVVHDGQVFVVYDNREDSWIASFDSQTGEQRWQTSRDETHSWATPLIWKNSIRTEIVVPGRKRNRSYSLDGTLLWEFNGNMSSLVIPSPFAAHGMCYISSGYIGDRHRPTFAIRPGAAGDITPSDGKEFSDSEFIAWYQPTSSSYNPSQIVYGDYLYTLYDRGFLTCHDAQTGREIYGKRRFTPRGSFTASPWAYNGHLFFLSEDGLTYAVKAGPEFEITATSDLQELCLSTPAVSGDRLLIRTASSLYCLTEGARLPTKDAASRQPASIETSTKIHRLATTSRSVFDAFAYINRIPLKIDKEEVADDLSARILSRLANQEGRILLKLPPGMDRDSYRGFKIFLRYEGQAAVGNCAACHTLPEFRDARTHVVEHEGRATPTLSLRNPGRRKINLQKVLQRKFMASRQKQSGAADDIDDAYSGMKLDQKDIAGLTAFLGLLNDVSDTDFRKLILKSTVLDTTEDLEN